MIREEPVTPVDNNVSAYLRQPRRTFEQAEQDRKLRQRQTDDAVAQATQSH